MKWLLPKIRRPDNFTLMFSFIDIGFIRSNFVGCEPFLESNTANILA